MHYLQTPMKNTISVLTQITCIHFQGVKKSLDLTEYYFAWTAIVATSSSGTCLNIWEKPGYPTNIHIKFGEIFYFRSDVIHSGGRLDVHTSKSGPKQLYERLHFYLPTKLQVANSLLINLLNLTSLQNLMTSI